jgi:hypothetical protein
MSNILVKAALAIVVGFSSFAATMPVASAAGIEASIETVGYRNGFQGDHERGRDRDGYRQRDRDRHHGNAGRRGHCSPWQAVEKAREHGLRRARVAHVTPRKVVVDGVRFHRQVSIAFANARHCPVLWR